jgi:uncharacterized protein
MPDPGGRLVVVNTTPIIALSRVGQLGLLKELFGRVVIPAGVRDELGQGGAAAPGAEVLDQPWVAVEQVGNPRLVLFLADLDLGEAEVLALAVERSADLVIIDERLARRHAIRLGLRLTGTLGVLIAAKNRGLLAAVTPVITRLRDAGLRIAPAVAAEACRLAGE